MHLKSTFVLYLRHSSKIFKMKTIIVTGGAGYIGSHTLIELLEKTDLKVLKRKFLISHVLYELILDHWILNQDPAIVSQIYQILENLPSNAIENFIRKVIHDKTKIQPLLESYQRFVERRFLNFYSQEENLVKALHRVSGKISQWEYNDLTEKSFISIIKQVKKEIEYEEVFSHVIKTRKLV